METCFFSETQFEAYHSRQLERLIGSSMPQYFPTRNQEGINGVDMVHFTNFHSLFFQYKVPVTLSPYNYKCRGLNGDCFRIKIYNRNFGGIKGQYELLWDWAATEPHVYYATPLFHTDIQFSRNYTTLLNHTAHFKFRGNLIDPYSQGFNNHQHYIYYGSLSQVAYMYSEEPVELKISEAGQIIEGLSSQESNKKEEFGTYLRRLKNKISEILFDRKLIGPGEIFRDRLLADENEVIDNYFICNYFLQKYFDLSWTVYIDKLNLNR